MKYRPLQIKVEGEELVMRIGIDTLSFAATQNNACHAVTNQRGFALDVINKLLYEDELGASITTNALDKAIQSAVDYGSPNVIH